MADTIFRPSTRLVRLSYLLIVAIGAAAAWALSLYPQAPPWLMAVPILALFIPIKRHIELQFTKLVLTQDGHLRHESGLISKSERSVRLDKMQDVAVSQSATQRMLGLGDISVETAGGSSRIEMKNLDNPRAIRDRILAAAKAAPHES